MNYIGSKIKLLPFIRETIEKMVGSNLSGKVFCDLFAGTGCVGRAFKSKVKSVISNDMEYYAYVLNRNYIGNHTTLKPSKCFKLLNSLPLVTNGFIYTHYCKNRQYFSAANGQKIDTLRQGIETLKTTKQITDNMYYFLLASLLESADKVANTASVYGAYLKHLKSTALQDLVLEPALFEATKSKHIVYSEDSGSLITKISGDILYLDPPYNARQYGANYHLLNTIAKYDTFTPQGKTGLRQYNRSKWCSKSTVAAALDSLISNADFEYIFMSYNDEGLLPLSAIKKIMSKYGDYSVASVDYQRFKADSNRQQKADKTTEYIHILVKNLP